ncbi:hypothetical protein A2446_05885 [Candidatus Roizmanbacteria bacterium RIFOXYC2_FULL_38_9]|uniref:Uncharacterized protein n=1 Tax=Candidatus Roizmanbacteria bacterium RIFOXYD1_FULL_38_12 TaxID=1802093 RepID=A0A1F7KZW5_9BACT|nr:MAG: hypothetical protein A3K47_01345 [Candidatus Roizmanbacteria bacterium RIFOXYA2_FULL_38_14]OGK63430.1 MAG: hypothetical protein A3K27_01345 [Candidatus Roizmanbacteria bacterium RIFOXYA1_FULL_37_12]OGK65276.1 MAG: hypothetical protein A3K38_01345 [Candidatus Roizmanbacteria bacterium RIFOXYB1_FULL_40_23]OGK69681.1 MAG: hypothetical protein A3K21_01350 [Candidatus Roizmanbacteria bacterium RIFOXYC1_FULL_38_14]OGK72831.1 MAG: hypothetical protein A2446_05885 [Candidatus Roizmanbacteria ba
MVGWEIDMKKKKIGTILILVMTMSIFGAIIYLSMLLSNKGEKSVTQIKKTKASAQTYHKLLALNVTPPDLTDHSAPTVIPDSVTSTGITSIPTPQSPSPKVPYVQTTLQPSVTVPTTTPVTMPSPTRPAPTLVVFTPTPTTMLLAYRTMTITPTLIPSRNTGGEEQKKSISPTFQPTRGAPIENKLPETGWVQLSTILFIVAVTTIFLSFLF